MDPVTIITISLIIICLLGISWFSGTDAPYVPTSAVNIKNILKSANLRKGRIFYELGSGDGRVVLEAAKLGADSTGIEQSWIRVWLSRYYALKLSLKNARFSHGNIFTRNYYPADVIYIYLLPPAVAKLEKKLKKELKPNSVVITQTYHFPNLKPYQKIDKFNFYKFPHR